MPWPDLTPLFGRIPWAVIGAVATRMYMPERATADLEVAILASDADQVARELAAGGWQRVGDLATGGSSWTSPTGEAVDVIVFDDPWAAEALAAAAANRDAAGLPILPFPYLVLTKLQAGRLQDTADISRMLGQAGEKALAQVRAAVKAHAPDSVSDIESLITLGRLELGKETGDS